MHPLECIELHIIQLVLNYQNNLPRLLKNNWSKLKKKLSQKRRKRIAKKQKRQFFCRYTPKHFTVKLGDFLGV